MKTLWTLGGAAVLAALIAANARGARTPVVEAPEDMSPETLRAASALVERELVRPLEQLELDREMFSRILIRPRHAFRYRLVPRSQGNVVDVVLEAERIDRDLRDPEDVVGEAPWVLARARVDVAVGRVEVLVPARGDEETRWVGAAAFVASRPLERPR